MSSESTSEYNENKEEEEEGAGVEQKLKEKEMSYHSSSTLSNEKELNKGDHPRNDKNDDKMNDSKNDERKSRSRKSKRDLKGGDNDSSDGGSSSSSSTNGGGDGGSSENEDNDKKHSSSTSSTSSSSKHKKDRKKNDKIKASTEEQLKQSGESRNKRSVLESNVKDTNDDDNNNNHSMKNEESKNGNGEDKNKENDTNNEEDDSERKDKRKKRKKRINDKDEMEVDHKVKENDDGDDNEDDEDGKDKTRRGRKSSEKAEAAAAASSSSKKKKRRRKRSSSASSSDSDSDHHHHHRRHRHRSSNSRRSRSVSKKRKKRKHHSRSPSSSSHSPSRRKEEGRSRKARSSKRRRRHRSRSSSYSSSTSESSGLSSASSTPSSFYSPSPSRNERSPSPATAFRKTDHGLAHAEQIEESEEQRGARKRRTIFISHISPNVTEKNIEDFFNAKAGRISSVRLIKDRFTNRSKGFGYVEFEKEETVKRGLELTGTKIQGIEIMVKPSEAEKNVIHGASNGSGAITRLFFRPVPKHLDEYDLRELFESLGDVIKVEIKKDEKGGRLGYGYVTYRRADDAKKALLRVNGVDFGGLRMRLGMWNEERAADATSYSVLDDGDTAGIAMTQQQRSMMMMNRLAPSMNPMASAVMTPRTMYGGNVSMNQMGIGGAQQHLHPQSGPSYLQQQQQSQQQIQASNSSQQALASQDVDPSMQQATQNILLSNMFDPSTETDPNFDVEIKADVLDECEKFGKILHIFVDKHSKGSVYLRFDVTLSAKKAATALHGRWFAKKRITATFMTDTAYFNKFPELIV